MRSNTAISAGRPYRSTGRIAETGAPLFGSTGLPDREFSSRNASTASGQRFHVPLATSTKTGTRPARTTPSAVAVKVLGGMITPLPRGRSDTASIAWTASVPLDTATQWAVPQKAAKSSSKALTLGPRM
ncbi:MAG: hypothetical protein BWX47_01729 [candidate division Hyd24-12 bacterium ADurb.Bin004]|nr:MAG: hypothetical protein BWX47_01729 [candidate division Hyd24-12 bacterium ADurb.Bin004]